MTLEGNKIWSKWGSSTLDKSLLQSVALEFVDMMDVIITYMLFYENLMFETLIPQLGVKGSNWTEISSKYLWPMLDWEPFNEFVWFLHQIKA